MDVYKESVMEYTDCDNCLYLEAENSDLEARNSELEEQITALQDAMAQIADIANDERG